ncbi:holo-ACP synthase [Oceanobacillus piezotolerans]|uniref:Holo-[acyl-carrier-protein] synthase n=1 Tax=Oceanobacillus piezotolerans TaxID=2448030 RepID=A0A498DJM6_9BACI|nr:holo-ACP synthase [Oceanobacillus piezotolerans]RLL42136.1 holo-ACP synthase [Oceanobacillus piezotolerans]
MIKGIGIDIIELQRIQQTMERNPKFVERILTEKERSRFLQLKTSRRKIEYLAGRFAAKEAVAKAYGTGIGALSFQDIEVLSNPEGAPEASIKGDLINKLHLSITHSKDYAVAQAIMEARDHR